ncbi:unnamed protein product [Rotaria sordida]|uniref:Uncharacterized protein n=2 Tax=Rotaria sordida TaxID=392033 RepID=A0A814SVW4_9BILA|nr:unnamed protein product [Rotaria sordida]CAF1393376.1 unnamed protein product [Rotaria sordida]CAF3746304.1 unnamed protein product [Rotaria sordida]CAF3868313.1 unnamed protein product [Rotaria sordida]
MASNTIHCEIIAYDLIEPTAIQIDEEHNAIYALTNYQLTRIDLNTNKDNVQIVCQHSRKFQGMDVDDDNENYSQGESDDDRDMPRVSDPFEDSEPSTDDDEEKITNRRNWRRYGWRIYQLDNPCSILFLSDNNQLVVLNEGVIKFLTIELEDNRPFVQGPSKNIFCYDFDVFNNGGKRLSVQPWSIALTSTVGVFVFSLLDNSQLYTLDTRNQNTIIQTLTTTVIHNCPCLLFHPQSNKIFVYDSTQILAMSPDDGTTVNVDLPFIERGKIISTMAIDKIGHIYILSDSTIFKCTWQSQLHLVECLGKIDVSISDTQMIVTDQGNQFYFPDMGKGCLYRCRKING